MHSVVARFVIGDFVYLARRRKGLTIDLSNEYIDLHMFKAKFLFFFPENSTIASGEVNTILFITVGHSMANAGRNTFLQRSTTDFACIFNSLTWQNSPEKRDGEKSWKMACNWHHQREAWVWSLAKLTRWKRFKMSSNTVKQQRIRQESKISQF